MKIGLLITIIALGVCGPALAQDRVVGVPNPDALFTSPDPILHRNKQTTYKIIKELLEAGHWDRADRYLTERYIQHNPNAASGRQGVVDFFTKVLQVTPKPIPDKMATQIVSVVAEGDIVTVAFPSEMPDPKDPSKTYTTTWFDSWRFVDGKADEHWDSALKPE
ncbi:nuclear transport factor 2 family protein [Caulobacter sp. SL161]|uniref:nuclear transport factor 2 family protein n=1 Tax=Caulobacter sp. SL161 TaxID=2995156 RepID=UPI00227293F5|nr:nuclear transport factor 2 family protein [Caulobacter sp. SL161]MCY1646622.1 nuclear transport factor 2 family protein [Caulobacter sp. SL161]